MKQLPPEIILLLFGLMMIVWSRFVASDAVQHSNTRQVNVSSVLSVDLIQNQYYKWPLFPNFNYAR